MSDFHDATILRRASDLLKRPQDEWLARAQHDVGECDECDAIRVATSVGIADGVDDLARSIFHVIMANRAYVTGNDSFLVPPADSAVHRELDAWRRWAEHLLDDAKAAGVLGR